MELDIEQFNVIGSQVPLLANLTPHGKVGPCLFSLPVTSLLPSLPPQYHMADLDDIGGIPVSVCPSHSCPSHSHAPPILMPLPFSCPSHLWILDRDEGAPFCWADTWRCPHCDRTYSSGQPQGHTLSGRHPCPGHVISLLGDPISCMFVCAGYCVPLVPPPGPCGLPHQHYQGNTGN